MRVMTIPDNFKWVENETKKNIDDSETLIRQSIGEAVPTGVIKQIAHNINIMFDYDEFIKSYSSKNNYDDYKKDSNFYIKSFIFEKELSNTKETGSFYTPQAVVYNTIKDFKTEKSSIRVLEPSVGLGAFIPQFLRLVDDCDMVKFDLLDISEECINLLKVLLQDLNLNNKFSFNYILDDFILHYFNDFYDAIISNPPYFKMDGKQKKLYSKVGLTKADNIFCLFLDKYRVLSDSIMCVIPKNFIMIPDSNDVRLKYQKEYAVNSIYDYGVNYFKEVFIEIISIHFKKDYSLLDLVHIENLRDGIVRDVPYNYIYHDTMWLLYRDEWFDNYISTLRLNCFDFYRDRQLTNKFLSSDKKSIWVVRSKNLLDDGSLIHKPGYDKYIDSLEGFVLEKYFGKEQLLFTNFTYNTRATILPKDCTVNGSFCILEPKNELKNFDIHELDLSLYSTEDFRRYYAIVKNLSKFTINVDSNAIYYIGVKK